MRLRLAKKIYKRTNREILKYGNGTIFISYDEFKRISNKLSYNRYLIIKAIIRAVPYVLRDM